MEYTIYTQPAELHKAINMLRGIVAGISTDVSITGTEALELAHWCELHADLENRHPFSEILPVVRNVLEDGIITEDESKDILWVCSSFADSGGYYDAITSTIQFLSGMIHGMMADGKLCDQEITALKAWLDANEFLSGTYPFDELYSLLSCIMADKKIDEDERNLVLSFCSNIVDFKNSFNLVEKDYTDLRKTYSVGGICAICPHIEFEGKVFCFTGDSYKCTRDELKQEIISRGGVFRNNVSGKTDYLVVGDSGNPCWAYACYGRKIEEAMSIRKEGGHVLIVNETDFWDAIYDLDANIT